MAKVVIVKSATNGLERRDGEEAVMVKRVAQAPTPQNITGLASDDRRCYQQKSSCISNALLQGEGSEDTVNRESVITNMKVSDADVVKAANQ